MHCSHRTIILAACSLVVLAAAWPMLDLTGMPNAAAQLEVPGAQPIDSRGASLAELNRSRINAILDEPIPDIEMQDKPFREVVVELQEMTGISMYFDAEELGDVIDPDELLTLKADRNSMTFRTFIKEFVLEQMDLDFVIRHNSLMIMSYDKYLMSPDAVQLVIYNCRDLFAGIPAPPAHSVQVGNAGSEDTKNAGTGSADPSAAGTAPARTENLHQIGLGAGFLPGGVGAMRVEEPLSDIESRQQQLVDLIRTMVKHQDCPWVDETSDGVAGVGIIKTYNGLLVISTLPEVHVRVRKLLRMLRESGQQQDWPAELGEWPRKAPPAGEEGKTQPGRGAGFF